MSEPKISIIIPVYNVEQYLAECLDSCINQTLEDIEIICVDDCSTDNSYKILEEYSKKDPRIKIFRQKENKKQGAARNRGLKFATGEYVWFVDSDDYIDTKACQILYDTIKKFDVDILCFSAIQFTETDKNRTFSYPQYFQGVQTNKVYHPKTNWKEIKFDNLNVVPWAYLTKKIVVQNFKFRENIFFEDTDFTPILLASVDSFCYIPYTAYFQRINPTSTTQIALSQKRIEDIIDSAKSLDEFITNNKFKKDHFLHEFLAGLINYIFNLCKSNQMFLPSNFDTLLNLGSKYRRKKLSLKRFIGKIFKKFSGDC